MKQLLGSMQQPGAWLWHHCGGPGHMNRREWESACGLPAQDISTEKVHTVHTWGGCFAGPIHSSSIIEVSKIDLDQTGARSMSNLDCLDAWGATQYNCCKSTI